MRGHLFDALSLRAESISSEAQPLPDSRPAGIATVELDRVQMQLASVVANERTEQERQKPKAVALIVDADRSFQGMQDRHLHGACAEMAVAIRLNVYWQAGTDGDDFDLMSPAGFRVEVKSTKRASGQLLVPAGQVVGRGQACDVFVHAVTKWLPIVIITGAVKYETIIKEENMRQDLRGAFCLPQSQLIRKLPK